jgi:alkaline phosphatase
MNVVMIISDGTGIGHYSALVMSSSTHNNKTVLSRFSHSCLVNTRPLTSSSSSRPQSVTKQQQQQRHRQCIPSRPFVEVTDSAAGAMALMTGQRVARRQIGGSGSPSWLIQAKRIGKKTAVIVSSAYVDATPAATAVSGDTPAHNRHSYQKSRQLMLSSFRPDVLCGAVTGVSDLEQVFKAYHGNVFMDVPREKSWTIPLAILYAQEIPAPVRSPSTANVVRQTLRAFKGHSFAMMIEASQVDTACHAGSVSHLLCELKALEDTVAAVLDNVDLSNTLVILTSDHDNGGVQMRQDRRLTITYNHHLPNMVPLFAVGKNAHLVSNGQAIIQQADIGQFMKKMVQSH